MMISVSACFFLALATRATAFGVTNPAVTFRQSSWTKTVPSTIKGSSPKALWWKPKRADPLSTILDPLEEIGYAPVTASDVATLAGVSLSKARQSLDNLAQLSQAANVGVSSETGDTIYQFSENLPDEIASRHEEGTFKDKASYFYVFCFLYLAHALNYGLCWFVYLHPGWAVFGATIINSIWLMIYANPFILGRREVTFNDDDGSLLHYLVLDPNDGLEGKRLRLAAKMIRQNQGAVIAEQLAPYCDPPKLLGHAFDEGFVRPIVEKLEGEAKRTPDGDVVYVFPELQRSALPPATNVRDDTVLEDSAILVEQTNKFCVFSDPAFGKRVLFVLLLFFPCGVVCGAIEWAHDPNWTRPYGLDPLEFGTTIYSFWFHALPLARHAWIRRENTEIEKRNNARRQWSHHAQSRDTRILRKRRAAEWFAIPHQRVSADENLSS